MTDSIKNHKRQVSQLSFHKIASELPPQGINSPKLPSATLLTTSLSESASPSISPHNIASISKTPSAPSTSRSVHPIETKNSSEPTETKTLDRIQSFHRPSIPSSESESEIKLSNSELNPKPSFWSFLFCRRNSKVRDEMTEAKNLLNQIDSTDSSYLTHSYFKAYLELHVNTTSKKFPKMTDIHLLKTSTLDTDTFKQIIRTSSFSSVYNMLRLTDLIYDDNINKHSYPERVSVILKTNEKLFIANNLASESKKILGLRVMERSYGNITDDIRYVHSIIPKCKYNLQQLISILKTSTEQRSNQISYLQEYGIPSSDIKRALEQFDIIDFRNTQTILNEL